MLSWSHRHPFSCQKGSFAIHAPTISGDVSVVTNHSVARNGDRKCVRAASLRNSTRRIGGTYPVRHFGIADGLPGRNTLKLFPDTLLEGGAANIQRQVQSDSRSLDEANYLCDELLIPIIPTDEIGLLETGPGDPGRAPRDHHP